MPVLLLAPVLLAVATAAVLAGGRRRLVEARAALDAEAGAVADAAAAARSLRAALATDGRALPERLRAPSSDGPTARR